MKISKTKLNKNLIYLVLFFIFVILIFNYYFGIFHYKYIVPPGDDCIRHMTSARDILVSGYTAVHEETLDPPAFHILLATLANITGLHLVSTTKYFMPFLVVLVIFSIYFIVNQYFKNKKLALISTVLFAFLSPQPNQIYDDGTYLNLISACFYLVFALAFIPKMIKSRKISRFIFLALLFSVAVIMSHVMAATYLILILIVLAIFLFLVKKFFIKFSLRNIFIFCILVILLLPFVWNYYLSAMFEKTLSSLGLHKIEGPNILKYGFSAEVGGIPKFGDYAWLLNPLLIYSALFGLVYLIFIFKKKKYFFEKLVLFIWSAVLFLGSRSTFFQLPNRFARDLAIPVCILAAIFVFQSLRLLKPLPRKIFLIIFVIFIILGLSNKMSKATKYNPMIRIQESDKQAINWIKNNTKENDVILVMPPTVAAGNWGSFIELLTARKTIPGYVYCHHSQNNKKCDPIYNPEKAEAMKYYLDHSINYVYAGKRILGSFIWKERIDWSYQKKLAKASFLEKVAEFPENESLGNVIIFKVNQAKLKSKEFQDK